jgi:hypothetical protein
MTRMLTERDLEEIEIRDGKQVSVHRLLAEVRRLCVTLDEAIIARKRFYKMRRDYPFERFDKLLAAGTFARHVKITQAGVEPENRQTELSLLQTLADAVRMARSDHDAKIPMQLDDAFIAYESWKKCQ